MANLIKEYIDIKEIKHNVEHIILSSATKNSKEQITEELFRALTRPRKYIST